MTAYNIYTLAGRFMGTYEGESEVDALHTMHLEADMPCTINDDDRLVFKSEEDENLAGNVEDWRVLKRSEDEQEEVDDEYCRSCGYDHNCNRCLMI